MISIMKMISCSGRCTVFLFLRWGQFNRLARLCALRIRFARHVSRHVPRHAGALMPVAYGTSGTCHDTCLHWGRGYWPLANTPALARLCLRHMARDISFHLRPNTPPIRIHRWCIGCTRIARLLERIIIAGFVQIGPLTAIILCQRTGGILFIIPAACAVLEATF